MKQHRALGQNDQGLFVFRNKNNSHNEANQMRKEVNKMITFLAMLLIVLIGIALSIFGVVATIAGLFWLLWPLLIVVGAFILVGYLIGKKKAKKETKEPIADAEFKEVDEPNKEK